MLRVLALCVCSLCANCPIAQFISGREFPVPRFNLPVAINVSADEEKCPCDVPLFKNVHVCLNIVPY